MPKGEEEVPCPKCGGNGNIAKPKKGGKGMEFVTCGNCRGTGKVKVRSSR